MSRLEGHVPGGANSPEEISEVEALAIAARKWDDLDPAIAERRQQVRDLLRRGLTYSMISQLLKVSDRTIKRDVAWLREVGRYWAEEYNNEREIGDSASLFEEVERLSMKMAEDAGQPFEFESKVVEVVKADGQVEKRVETKKILVDHNAVALHLRNALAARVQKHVMLRNVGMMKTAQINVNLNGRIDVATLTDEQLRQAQEANDRQLAETRARLARLEGANPLAGPDKEPWED